MAREKSSTNIRELFYGVRLKITLTIIVLVAFSIFVYALTLLQSISQVRLTEQETLQIISDTQPDTQRIFFMDVPQEALQDYTGVLYEEFVERRAQGVTRLTPLIVLASGVIAYAVARQILRPIKDSYSAQERFMQDAAHEFRNPLAALKVTVQNIKSRGTLDKDDALKLLKSTETQVNRLISINEDLLYLERKEESLSKKSKKLNISELLLDVLEDLESLARQQNLKIISKIQDDISLRIPAERFVKIAQNIIGNAIKYSKPGSGEVRVSLTEKNGSVRLSVRDFGVGIPSDDLAQIGRRFYRASNTSAFSGTGLGMAIVQKAVSAQGGQLTVNSKPDEGTHVVVNL
ncbi:TPA: HAMP domain-containing histidine kinase [Candidatus Saccharibacteria bacterium]|nr:HAMP domain-containing histidine kinase [Candidatus Saccharibacteria bacterium]HIO87568.1 HAMP domain-containing histidine kinase [Candidatus Saccharibacteria bacterium]